MKIIISAIITILALFTFLAVASNEATNPLMFIFFALSYFACATNTGLLSLSKVKMDIISLVIFVIYFLGITIVFYGRQYYMTGMISGWISVTSFANFWLKNPTPKTTENSTLQQVQT